MPNEGCTKCSYPSRSRALAYAKRRLRDNPTLYLRAYLCKACGLWHLTSKLDRFDRKELTDVA